MNWQLYPRMLAYLFNSPIIPWVWHLKQIWHRTIFSIIIVLSGLSLMCFRFHKYQRLGNCVTLAFFQISESLLDVITWFIIFSKSYESVPKMSYNTWLVSQSVVQHTHTRTKYISFNPQMSSSLKALANFKAMADVSDEGDPAVGCEGHCFSSLMGLMWL